MHTSRDCVGIIAGVQHIDGPLDVKYWGGGGPDPCDLCGVDAYVPRITLENSTGETKHIGLGYVPVVLPLYIVIGVQRSYRINDAV